MLSLFFVLFSLFPQAHAEQRLLQEQNNSLPNLLCQYSFVQDHWQFLGPSIAVFEMGGKRSFGNVFASINDKVPPGNGICMARDYDEQHRIISLKIFTYSFEKEFSTMPGTCNVTTEGQYEITDKIKVTPEPGLVTEMTVDRNNGTKLRYTNYFLTEADEMAWSKHLDLIIAKCEELAPKQQP